MRIHVILLFATLASIAACTFPSVEYTDAGTNVGGTATTYGTGSGDCSALPKKCSNGVDQCVFAATKHHESCDNKCKPNDAACGDACDDDYEMSVGVCKVECRSCATAEGCSEPIIDSCADLFGG